MRTSFRVRQPYADIFMKCAQSAPCVSPVRPENFIMKMRINQACIAPLSGMGLDENGLERKNPLIVALGDSVTAGQFESLVSSDPELGRQAFARAMERMKYISELGASGVEKAFREGSLLASDPITVADPRESYVEKFRQKLIDKYIWTSVSAVNSGIGGDNLISMAARAERDVIRYQPDLVLLNGVLNWSPELGTTSDYKSVLQSLVRRIKSETDADIILLTPNGDLPDPLFGAPPEGQRTLDRVNAVREVAREENVCLADVYAVWEQARAAGCPWEELLCNRLNHPGAEGHEVYAITLMKLFE